MVLIYGQMTLGYRSFSLTVSMLNYITLTPVGNEKIEMLVIFKLVLRLSISGGV